MVTRYVKVTKLETQNPGDLHDGYWVTGYLSDEVELNRRIVVWREVRNAMRIDGHFISSPIKSLIHQADGITVVKTENSTYKIEDVNRNDYVESTPA